MAVPARLIVALLCMTLLAACTTGFFYRRIDSIGYWYVAREVSLDKQQSAALRGSMQRLFDWQRASGLPRYADFLERLATQARGPLSRAGIDAARLEAEGFWHDFAKQASPDMAAFFISLTAGQRDQLFANLGKGDAKDRRKLCEISPRKEAARREKAFMSVLEDWVGRLSESQQRLITQRLARIGPSQCKWLENRIRYRAGLRALIDAGLPKDRLADRLARYIGRPQDTWPADYRREYVANRDAVLDLLAALEPTLTPRQRDKRAERLERYARDFRQLAGPAGQGR